MRRRTAVLSATVTTAAMLATALTLPSASADVALCRPLPTGTTLAEGPAVMKFEPASYQVTATTSRWAVVGVRGSQGDDPDLRVGPKGSCSIRQSLVHDRFAPDWVAFNVGAGRLAPGAFTAQVLNGSAGHQQLWKYVIQFESGGSLSVSPWLIQPIGLAGSDWLVDIRDVTLQGGVTYKFGVTGAQEMSVYVLSSTSDPATWAHSASTSTPRLTLPGDDPSASASGTFTVRPTATGRYGVLFARDLWGGPPTVVTISVA